MRLDVYSIVYEAYKTRYVYYGLRRMVGGKKRKPKLYQLYLPLYYLLFTYYFIYILSKNTRVYEKGLIKKTIQFYILWHKEIFIDYQDKRAIIELNVNIIMMREMSFFFRTFQISCHNEPLYFQSTILKCIHILTYVYIRVITRIKIQSLYLS